MLKPVERNLKKAKWPKMRHVQLIARMTHYVNNWLLLSNVEREYDEFYNFIIRDQLLSNCKVDL